VVVIEIRVAIHSASDRHGIVNDAHQSTNSTKAFFLKIVADTDMCFHLVSNLVESLTMFYVHVGRIQAVFI
jgi:hypothetical protein